MDGLKGFAEIAEHILYEALGLVIPGAVSALAVAYALDPAQARAVISAASSHPWWALAGAYVVGYAVQSLSRPLTTVFEWVLQRPARLFALGGRLMGVRAHRWAGERLEAFEHWLTRRHAHQHGRDARAAATPVSAMPTSPRVTFSVLLHDRWVGRLAVAPESRLTEQQVKDLCYSVLSTDERKSLVRFRAAASLTRGVATVVVIASVILVAQVLREPVRLTWSTVGILELLIVAFYAMMERGDMYDRLWTSVLYTQTLGLGVDGHSLSHVPRTTAESAAGLGRDHSAQQGPQVVASIFRGGEASGAPRATPPAVGKGAEAADGRPLIENPHGVSTPNGNGPAPPTAAVPDVPLRSRTLDAGNTPLTVHRDVLPQE